MAHQQGWHIEGQQQPFDQKSFTRILALLVEERLRERARRRAEEAGTPAADSSGTDEEQSSC
ncbi:hypothetical protein [Kitasatospora sp. P5_F3]